MGSVLPGHGVPLPRATDALVKVMTDKRLQVSLGILEKGVWLELEA